MATEAARILSELELIKQDLSYIKEHIVDVDVVLTDDDTEALREAEKDFKERRTKRL